jgi:hypothetical protein
MFYAGSSTVEFLIPNQAVVGSSPARRAAKVFWPWFRVSITKKRPVTNNEERELEWNTKNTK